jgi:hypothetical protein
LIKDQAGGTALLPVVLEQLSSVQKTKELLPRRGLPLQMGAPPQQNKRKDHPGASGSRGPAAATATTPLLALNADTVVKSIVERADRDSLEAFVLEVRKGKITTSLTRQITLHPM